MVVYAINGYGDEGNWDIELFSDYEKAKNAFEEYISDFKTMYSDAEWDINNDMASYDNDNHYDTFWIDQIKVQ